MGHGITSRTTIITFEKPIEFTYDIAYHPDARFLKRLRRYIAYLKTLRFVSGRKLKRLERDLITLFGLQGYYGYEYLPLIHAGIKILGMDEEQQYEHSKSEMEACVSDTVRRGLLMMNAHGNERQSNKES